MDRSTVVSSATSLIALAWLEQLTLLPQLFGSIHVPQAVWDELLHNPDATGVAEFRAAPWLKVTPVTDHAKKITTTAVLYESNFDGAVLRQVRE